MVSAVELRASSELASDQAKAIKDLKDLVDMALGIEPRQT
jgi:hypothetical protein